MKCNAVPLALLALVACRGAGEQREELKSAPPAVRDTEFLEQWAATNKFRLGHPTSIVVGPGARDVFFLRSGPRSLVRDLYVFDVATGEERVLLTAESILRGAAEKLSPEERARRERLRLTAKGIASFELSRDGARLLVPLSGRLFVVERQSGAVTELINEGGYPNDAGFSPDGALVACVREGELYVIDVVKNTQTRLTKTARPDLTNGLPEFVAQEEMERYRGYFWSPDGKLLAYQETDTTGVERFTIADPAHPETAVEAWPYPRAGKANAKVRLGIIAATGGATRWVSWDAESLPYLASVVWEEGAPLTLLVQNRKQTDEKLLAVEPGTGATRELLAEHDDAWLNLDPSVPRWLQGSGAFLWSTERDGQSVLELRAKTGERVRSLTPDGLTYRSLVGVNEAEQLAYVLASPEPTETHLYRVHLDSAVLPERMSEGAGVHGATFAKDGQVFVHTVDDAAGERHAVVRGADGKVRGELKTVAEAPPFVPKPILQKVGEAPGLYTALLLPRSAPATGKLPVIVRVYAGPGIQSVTANARAYLLDQWLADQGYAVAVIDGRGTPARGRAWERTIKNDLIEAPLADQVAGLQALAAEHSELDLTRVGIYGWSFGGYASAMAVLRYPDVFKVAVAGAPVTDWRDYDTHYTERYMGLVEENEKGYVSTSAVELAAKLTRPLLLVHGTADDNVYFMHALKLSDALFRAGKPHEFLPLVNFTHMVPEPQVTVRLYSRIATFLGGALR